MHYSSQIILITLSKCAQIKEGVCAVTLKRVFFNEVYDSHGL